MIDFIEQYKESRQKPLSLDSHLKLKISDDPHFNPQILYNPNNNIDKKILKILIK